METSTKFLLAGAAAAAVGYYVFFCKDMNKPVATVAPPQPPALPPQPPPPPPKVTPVPSGPAAIPFAPSTPEVQAALNTLSNSPELQAVQAAAQQAASAIPFHL